MQVAASVAGSLAAEPSRLLFGTVYARMQILFKFRSNLNSLEKQMENLISRRDDVKRELDAADREGKLPKALVDKWLSNVTKLEIEINTMRTSMADRSSNTCGCGLNCALRCKFSNRVVKMLEEVAQLLKDGDFPTGVAAVNHLPVPVEHIPGPSIEGQLTASRNLAKIMELLSDDKVRTIGIWGMGGVVSKKIDLKRVQMQLAERLKLVNLEESPEIMAKRLHERLEKEKKFLLILDDVWDAIDLDLLGVPLPEVDKGSKIILTSRSTQVCRQMMTDVNFKVDVLNDEESWQLFCQNAGAIAMLEPIKPSAEAVAKECGGLPLALKTVGKSMRGNTMVEVWDHALDALRMSMPSIEGIEDKLYRPIKWSYDLLQSEQLKSCFLCCCLYPEDFSIEVSELIQLWFAEGLLDKHQSYEALENQGMAIIGSLMDSCLLDPASQGDAVKMHDVVRDVAIWIASSTEDGIKSFIQSGIGLRQLPDNDLWKSSKRLSFVNNEITRLPDSVMLCPQASTLLLRGSRFLEKVPHSFLLGFQVLRILVLSGSCIRSLPDSLLQLGELRALLLRGCNDLQNLPPLEGLSRLQILDCSGTRISTLPEGMEKMTNLRQLDLSYTSHLKTINSGTLSKLSNLEFLNMRCSGYWWGMEENVKMGHAPFEEILRLERLTVLYIDLQTVPHSTSKDFTTWIQGLKKFGIFISDYGRRDHIVENSEGISFRPPHFVRRHVSLRNYNLSAARQSWWLLINATSVDICGCSYINLMLENLAMNSSRVGSFAGLKSLTIGKCKYGFQPGVGRDGAQFDMLPNLEHLHLFSLDFLDSLSDLVHYLGLKFSRLRLLEVIGCPQLKYLLSIGGSILVLRELKEIKVRSCEKFDELFRYGSSGQIMDEEPVVPNLKMLELKGLPKLETLCKENELLQQLEQLEVLECNLVRKLPLTVQKANNIKEIRGEQQWWSQLEWDEEGAKSSLELYFTSIMVNPC
ncbi:unnamed protein product [Ilex paraguariensis]|uniref:Disease resistance protein n=1 Tax=Ilex paraguariensis TaxID=185542 RepID=A0ABC8S051_9AQUA